MSDLTVFGGTSGIVTPEYLRAVDTLQSGEIPPDAIKTHPGKGGKEMSYVSHAWVSEQLRIALGPLWSESVERAELFEDGSAFALVTLTIYIPRQDGTVLSTHITEAGVFEGAKSMPTSAKIASAISRGLVKCAMRRFGIGAELYDQEEELTPEQKALSLLDGLTRRIEHACGVDFSTAKNALKNILREQEISKMNINEKWGEAYAAVSSYIRAQTGKTYDDD